MSTNGDAEKQSCSKHGDALPYHLEVMNAKNGHHAVSEERGSHGQALREPLSAAGRALVTELTTLRADIVDLECEVERYGTKEAEFKDSLDQHLEEVKRCDKTLHSNIEGLESEQSQLRVLCEQQESEQAWLQLRDKEGVEQCQQTERRIQVLMDKLVVLLSASGFSGTEMHAGILEDLQSSIRKIEVKVQTVQSQLDRARQENREAAVKLSEEQRKTKRLHDELCGKQGDLFSRKLCTMASSASSSLEPGRSKPAALWCKSAPQPGPPEAGAGISQQPFTERPTHSWVPCGSPVIPENGSASFDSSRGSPSMSSRSARERLPPAQMQMLEEQLKQVLTRVHFEDEVIRMATGIYRFGNESAQLRLTDKGDVFASQDEYTWQPVADFVDGLRARRAWQSAHGNEPPASVTNGRTAVSPLRACVVAPGRSPGSVSPADDAAGLPASPGHAARFPPEFESLYLGSKKDGAAHPPPSWHKSCGSDKVMGTSVRGSLRRNRDGMLLASRRQDPASSPSCGSHPPTASPGTRGPWGGGSGSFTSLGGGGGSLEEGGGSLTSICSGGACASSNSSLHQGSAQASAGPSARRSNPGSVHGLVASPVSTPLSPLPPVSPSRTAAVPLRPEPQQTVSPLRAAVQVVASGSCCASPHPANAAAGLASAGFVQSPCRRRPSSAQPRSASHSNSPVRASVVKSVSGASSQPGSMIIPIASAARGGSGSSTPSPLRSQLPTRAGSLNLPSKQVNGVVARPLARPSASTDADASLRARPFREVSPLPASGALVPGQSPNIYRGPSPVRPPVSNPGQLLSAHAATGRAINVLESQGATAPVARVAVRASSASPTPRARSMYVQSPHNLSGGSRVVTGAISPQHVWRT
mmetsp:Transcript_1436/g.3919  ORF Transcript_1436/g.3919 Transcript_1436/m.3919 type:complete len:872 (+) Transcript_1436:58-2673(+)